VSRIDFYILADAAPGARDHLACRIAEKAYKAGHRVYLLAESAPHAARIDELLWTFRDGSFVPHERDTPRSDPATPILIGEAGTGTPAAADVMINLAAAAPDFFDRYTRVAEIVDASPEGRQAGRERFRFYRERGLEPHSHNID
jgi:DNA polymerase-3 subunit chi